MQKQNLLIKWEQFLFRITQERSKEKFIDQEIKFNYEKKAIHHNFKILSYDSDKSGAIDKKEMTRVMKSIYAMLGTKGTDRSSLDEKVCFFFWK